jgi:hypothetical protein
MQRLALPRSRRLPAAGSGGTIQRVDAAHGRNTVFDGEFLRGLAEKHRSRRVALQRILVDSRKILEFG